MDDAASPKTDPLPSELDELIEPITTPAPPHALETGADLASPDGQRWVIRAFVRQEAGTNVYQAEGAAENAIVTVLESCDSDGSDRLRREVEVFKDIGTPMFPRLLTSFDVGGRTYVVFEAIDGETLASRDRPLRDVLSAVAQVAFGVRHLHERGWAHLGLRPDVIVPGRPIKIVDQTYLTRLGERPRQGFFHAGYSAPELALDAPASVEMDVYSIGAILYRTVASQPLDETGSGMPLNGLPTLEAGIPQLLTRCLGEPKTRYRTAAELHGALLRQLQRSLPRAVYSFAGASTVGIEPARASNQDAFGFAQATTFVDEEASDWAAFAVADGMGGMAAGEVASRVAIATLQQSALGTMTRRVAAPTEEEQVKLVREWVHAANIAVCDEMHARRIRGGTTLLAGLLVHKRLAIGHVGDCRLYLIDDQSVRLVTRDHSLAVMNAPGGAITADEMRKHPDRNVLTRSLGERPRVDDEFVDTLDVVTGAAVTELEPGTVLLLCSDGLWEPLGDDEMATVVRQSACDLNTASRALLRLALKRGSSDNVTALLVRYDEVEGSPMLDARPAL